MSDDKSLDHVLHMLLRSRYDPGSAEWLEQRLRTTTDVDWDALVGAAKKARVAPLVYLVLRDKDWLPAGVRDQLHTFYFATARRNLLAFTALSQVIARLNAHGIPNILLKGVALALALYKNEALRPMDDVDLLVHWSDVPRVIERLRELGYDTPIPEVRPGARLAYDGELFLCSGDPNAAPIDLHWNLINAPQYRRSAAEAWLWDSAQPVKVGEVEGRVLCPEALLLHLCAHKVLHHSHDDTEAAALWGYDIAVLLAQAPIDWAVVLAKAQELDMIAPLQRALPAVVLEWEVSVPDMVLEALSALHPSRTERRMMRWAASDHQKTGLRAVWTNVWAMPNLWASLRYVWALAFPSVTYMRDHYGMPHVVLLPVYYLRRWLRGMRITG